MFFNSANKSISDKSLLISIPVLSAPAHPVACGL
jgi:hypothetical protein